jgi:hypothetical protein
MTADPPDALAQVDRLDQSDVIVLRESDAPKIVPLHGGRKGAYQRLRAPDALLSHAENRRPDDSDCPASDVHGHPGPFGAVGERARIAAVTSTGLIEVPTH